ncbi:MAG: hypothetical protein WC575_00010 [Patescibacteria group bacterium]
MDGKIKVAVVDGKITDEAIGGIMRRAGEIAQRVEYGVICFDWAMDQLQRIIEGRLSVPLDFPVWKTIKLGTYKSIKDLQEASGKAGYNIVGLAIDLLKQPAFAISLIETNLDLVVVSGRELGLPKITTHQKIYERAFKQRLSLCPNEVGPQLRLQYPDQPMPECLFIAMETITCSTTGFGVFSVTHSKIGLLLDGIYGCPDSVCHADDRWIFTRPRSK